MELSLRVAAVAKHLALGSAIVLISCTNADSLSSDIGQQSASQLVSARGTPFRSFEFDETRGRAVVVDSDPISAEVTIDQGLVLSEPDGRVTVLDKRIPRIVTFRGSPVLEPLDRPMFNQVAASQARCPIRSLDLLYAPQGGALLPWNQGSQTPLIARYLDYTLARFDQGLALLPNNCVLQTQTTNAWLSEMENAGADNHDLTFGLEIEFFQKDPFTNRVAVPFSVLRDQLTRAGAQVHRVKMPITNCRTVRKGYAIENGSQRIFDIHGNLYKVVFDDNIRVLESVAGHINNPSLRTVIVQNIGGSIASVQQFDTHEAANAALAGYPLTEEHRFLNVWHCDKAGTSPPDTWELSVAEPPASWGRGNHVILKPESAVDENLRSLDAYSTLHFYFALNSFMTDEELGDGLLERFEAKTQGGEIETWASFSFPGLPSNASIKMEMSQIGVPDPKLFWEVILPPLELTAQSLNTVHSLWNTIKTIPSQGRIDVRGDYQVGIHTNMGIPRDLIAAGLEWEVARDYIVAWMQNRVDILDAYFPTEAIFYNRQEFYGEIAESVVAEMEAIDHMALHDEGRFYGDRDLMGWLHEVNNIARPKYLDVNAISAKVDPKEHRRLEIRVWPADFSEPWQMHVNRIRFSLGLMHSVAQRIRREHAMPVPPQSPPVYDPSEFEPDPGDSDGYLDIQ